MLPVLLESLVTTTDKAATVDDAVAAQLRNVMNVPNISTALVQALLRRKRVLAVFDGFSEASRDDAGEMIRPEKGTVYTQALIITSRVATNLSESLVIRPKGLTLSFLDRVLDGLIATSAAPGRFSDSEREEFRRHARSLIENARDGFDEHRVPMIFLKLMTVRADRLLNEGKPLEDLPRTLSELVNDYTEQLLRNEKDLPLAMHEARTAAEVCMGEQRIPMARSVDRYIAKGVSKEKLEKFVAAGLMVSSGRKGDPFYKFALDPVAEQLDANRLVIDIREERANPAELDDLLHRWGQLSEDFAQALRRAAAAYRQSICANQSALSLKLWPQEEMTRRPPDSTTSSSLSDAIPTLNPKEHLSRGGPDSGNVGGNVDFRALGDIVGGDKIIYFTSAAPVQVFISATTRELGSYRKEIGNTLLTLGIFPIEQTISSSPTTYSMTACGH
jgi:hypothetical protein